MSRRQRIRTEFLTGTVLWIAFEAGALASPHARARESREPTSSTAVVHGNWQRTPIAQEETFSGGSYLLGTGRLGMIVVGNGHVGCCFGVVSAWYSRDGRRWETVAPAQFFEPASETRYVSGVVPTRTGFVAVGNDGDFGDGEPDGMRHDWGRIWISRDGIHWRDVARDRKVFLDGQIDGVGVAAGFMIAFGSDLRVPDLEPTGLAMWRSTDGNSWERLKPPSRAFHGATISVALPWRKGIVVAGGVVSAGVREGAVWFSKTGRDWRRLDRKGSFDAPRIEHLIHTSSGLLAIGTRTLRMAMWRSSDARIWHPMRVPSELAQLDTIKAIASGPWGIVALAESPDGAESQRLVISKDDGRSWQRLVAAGRPFAATPWGPIELDSIGAFGKDLVLVGGTPVETSNTPATVPTAWYWRPSRPSVAELRRPNVPAQ